MFFKPPLKGVYFFEKNIKLGNFFLSQPHLLVWRFHKISLRSLTSNTPEPELPEVGKGCHLVCIPGDTQNVTQNAHLMTFYWHFGCILDAYHQIFFYNMRRLKINFWCFLEVKIVIFGLRQLDTNNSQINYQNDQFQSNWYKNELLGFLEGQDYHFWIEAVRQKWFPN